MKKVLKEPLVHFLLLGLLLYIITGFVQHKNDKGNEIVVDNATIGRLVSKYIIQTGVPPDKQQLDALINEDIKEEIEYREAISMGLDKDDEIIRRRLSQKIEFLTSDLAVVPNPTLPELQQFYNAHADLFRDSTKITFTHIYLNGDDVSVEKINERANAIRTTLNDKRLVRAPELGDRFSLAYDYTDIDKLEAQQLFGNSQLADTLFNIPLHQWIGPVKSGYGWHLIYLQQKEAGRVLPFNEVKNAVQDAYVTAIKQQDNDKRWNDMKNKYVIKRQYLETTEK